jgi:tetratricopeptide (TPR) repeat protein
MMGSYYARSGNIQKASRVLHLFEKSVNRNNLEDLAFLHRLEGEIELARGNSPRALELLHLADNEHLPRRAPERRDPLILESLANAYRMTGNLEQAIGWYEKLLGLANKPLTYEPLPLWLEAHYHLAQAYATRGQKDRARRPIEALLAIWKEADSDLPLLVQARRLRAELEN